MINVNEYCAKIKFSGWKDSPKELKELKAFLTAERLDEKAVNITGMKCVNVKFPLLMLLAFAHKNSKALDVLKSNIKKVMPFVIDADDIENINTILGTGFVTAKIIDEFIKYAIDSKKTEIQVLLTNYKHENFGTTDPAAKFKL